MAPDDKPQNDPSKVQNQSPSSSIAPAKTPEGQEQTSNKKNKKRKFFKNKNKGGGPSGGNTPS